MLTLYRTRSKGLAQTTGITEQNLSPLRQNRTKGIRLATPEVIYAYLVCQPGGLLGYLPSLTEG